MGALKGIKKASLVLGRREFGNWFLKGVMNADKRRGG